MNSSLFSIDNFNVIEDSNYYYVFRALNVSDHNDRLNFVTNGNIRTDRERYEEMFGTAKYSSDSDISLEEVWDHIKMHYSKETNCISFSTNANVSLDYGSNYYDEYTIVRIPKIKVKGFYYAGCYMLQEVNKEIEKILNDEELDDEIRNLVNLIDNSNSNEEIINIVKNYSNKINYDKDILSRFQDRQYFNSAQQLEYNKIVARLTILEISGIKPSIISRLDNNSSLLATINNAFSSGEVLHYMDVGKEYTTNIPKNMVKLLSLAQQLKDKNINGAQELERRIIDLVYKGYDLVERDGEVVLTNGEDIIDCNLLSEESVIFKDIELDKDLVGVREIYNITGGGIDYQKAKRTIDFCYSLALGKREVYDYASVVSAIMGNDSLTDSIIDNTVSIKSDFIDRGNGRGYKLCESVNIGMNNEENTFYSISEQKKFIDTILGLDIDTIDQLLDNRGLAFRKVILDMLVKSDFDSLENYYAKSIVEGIDYKKIVERSFNKESFSDEEKNKLIKDLSNCNISRLYEAFNNSLINPNDIPYYILNLLIEGSFNGYSLKELCELDNLDLFIEENYHVLNKDVNPYTLNRYFNIIDDSNYIPNSSIVLRDYQLRIKEEVDSIYNDNRRFAGVVLPTGAGKSFVAMSLMLDRKDTNMVYIAPRLEILRQFKKHIVRYVAGFDPTNMTDKELDMIVKDCFPHLDLYCYQGLDKNDEEKLKKYDADFIILDEIHHVGAEKWNPAITTLLSRNSNSKVLGITATPFRDMVHGERNSREEADMMRAMAVLLDDYTTQELCEKRYLACDINIVDAIQEGYIVCPRIVSFDYGLEDSEVYKNAVQMVSREKDSITKSILCEKLSEMKRLIDAAEVRGMDKLIQDYIQDDKGRYILFIPRKPIGLIDKDGNTISTDDYIEQEIEKFKKNIGLVDKKPSIDFIHSGRKKDENAQAIRSFESDNDPDHIKILVAIDMLNEGVHLNGIKGSFNFRKIDSNHQILLLQHLGRTIFALDPNKKIEEKDIPVIFDIYNNYSNLNMERMVNRTNSSSDLEKLKDIMFWIKKYGFIPQTNSNNYKEKKKAITLRKIQQKYSKYLDEDIDKLNLSLNEKYEIKEILILGKQLDLWNVEFAPVSNEEVRRIDRVNIFNVSAVQRELIDLCNYISANSSSKEQSKNVRVDNVLAVLDYLSEYNLKLDTESISTLTTLDKLLSSLDDDIKENILFELKKRGIKEDYLLGKEYYFARSELYNPHGYFVNFDSSVSNITNFRKYGLFANGSDYNFVNDDGFIMRGPKKFLYKNVWTGTYFSQEGYSIQGFDHYGFSKDGIHKDTEGRYDKHGFDVNHINNTTHNFFDKHGFNIDGINKDTLTKTNKGGFDIDGYWYDNSYGNYVRTSRKYDREGYDIDGYDKYGFNKRGIHKDTGETYDSFGFGKDGYYWKQFGNKRVKTESTLNDQNFDRYGNLYRLVDGKLKNMGKVYDSYGFYFDGTHYKTGTKYDERGFDKEHNWHHKLEDGTYGPSQGPFNDKGWNIDRKTRRYYSYGTRYDSEGKLFLDFVDDHGFDEKGNYHNPVVGPRSDGSFDDTRLRIDQDGFIELYGGTIYYSKRCKTGNNKKYDIHGFNSLGIHRLTGTKLNPYNFDIDGYYYVENENGEMINTGLMHNERGFTIDKKAVIETKYGLVYSRFVNGFDIDGRFINKGFYDDNGFNVDGIHYETGTNLDPNNFDRNGYLYEYDENGNLVNTNSKYDKDGWSQNRTHISTGTPYDKHGFNFYHLYKNKSGGFDVYDKHGFDYLGIHKTTKNKLNSNNFDIDGYYYKKNENGEMINTGSKYDDGGFDIDRLNKYKFSKNDYYRGTRKKVDPNGFYGNRIHSITDEIYDLMGRDIDGEKVKLTDEQKEKLKELREMLIKMKKILIEQFFDSLDDFAKEAILSAYDYDYDEFDESEYLDCFIDDVSKFCTKEDFTNYTTDEIYDFVKEKSIIIHEKNKRRELDEMAEDFYRRDYLDGDIPDLDYEDTYRF